MLYRYTDATPSLHPKLGLLEPDMDIDVPEELIDEADACASLRRVDAVQPSWSTGDASFAQAAPITPQGPDEPDEDDEEDEETASA